MSQLSKPAKSRTATESRRPLRRTQAERSEATRERVISAAIDVLHTRGYSGATTLAIREAAGVSMGALQHQFPTKAKLMAAVLDRLTSNRLAMYEAAVQDVADPLQRALRMLDVSQSLLRESHIPATLEIQLATRNDPELGEELRPVVLRVESRMQAIIKQIAVDAGLTDTNRFEQLRLLNSAMLRGLVTELASGGSDASVDAALAVWQKIITTLFTQEMDSAEKKGSRKGRS